MKENKPLAQPAKNINDKIQKGVDSDKAQKDRIIDGSRENRKKGVVK